MLNVQTYIDSIKLKLFTTNSKLKKDGIYKFSLPMVKSCPGAGSCKAICYYRKFYRMYPNVSKSHQNNLSLTKLPQWWIPAISEIDKRKIKVLRWHDSGDIYSQNYLNDLYIIALNTSDTKHYFYTKSLHLDFTEISQLPNVYIIQSFGGKYDHLINLSLPHSRVFNTKEECIHAGYTDCTDSDLRALTTVKIGLIKH